MSDEEARIFGRERRHLGLTVSEYLHYLAEESEELALNAIEGFLNTSNYTLIPAMPWENLKHHASWDAGFQTVSYGDAEYTLVRPAQLLAEIISEGCGQGEGCNGSGVRDDAHPTCPPIVPPGWRIVERCGICEQFDDDLEAANAVSEEAHWVECNAGYEHVIARGLTAFAQQGNYLSTPLIAELQDLANKNILIALSG